MTRLESYIWKSTLFSIVIVWLALTLLDSFFSFLQEVDSSSGRYQSLEALLFVAYNIPQRMYDYFPTATLIGALLGLGQLAANSELTAMRAAGVSINNVVIMVLKLGLVLMLVVVVLGEWVAPASSLKAISFKTEKQQQNIGINRGGLWLKDGARIIHVQKAWSKNKFSNVNIYTISDHIDNIQYAETAIKQGDQWLLQNVRGRVPSDNGIYTTYQDQLVLKKLVPASMLDIASIKAKNLSVRELSTYIDHQDSNHLNTIRLEQAFWSRLSTPLSTLVMLILAIPFAFSSQRNAGAGQRLFIGILVGLIFFLLNRSMGHISIVYGFSPFFSSLFPLMLFLLAGLLMLKRVR